MPNKAKLGVWIMDSLEVKTNNHCRPFIYGYDNKPMIKLAAEISGVHIGWIQDAIDAQKGQRVIRVTSKLEASLEGLTQARRALLDLQRLLEA